MPFKSFASGNGRKPRSIYPILIVPIIALAVLVGIVAYIVPNMTHASPVDQLVAFPGTIPTVVAHSQMHGAADQSQTISLTMSLRLRNATELKSYVQDTANTKSVNFDRHLTAAQFQAAFSPSVAAHNDVLNYLQAAGFRITHTYKNRMLIGFTGTIGQAESAFHVSINTYTAPNGTSFYANSANPLLPASIAGAVQDISGLNSVAHYAHPPIHSHASQAAALPHDGNGCPATGGKGYLTPDQTSSAYNFTGMYAKGDRGEGQSVAVFELAGFSMSDLTTYENCYGHSHTAIQTIAVTGGVPNDGGVVEVELDAELILSAAPNLNQLKIYEAANTAAGYTTEWAQIVNDATPVVSSSWGQCEADTTSDQIGAESNFFMTAAAQGQTVFSAAGDNGSSDCLGNGPTDPNMNALSVDDPSGQPFITGVGGTTLNVNADGSYSSEKVWNDTNPDPTKSNGGGGGGLSTNWPQPSWQSAPGVQNQFSNGKREVPDVTLSADPQTGYPIYCSVAAAGCSPAGFFPVGGTSAASPMWAAYMAMVNEQSIKAGGFNIGFVNPLLYQIASGPDYAMDFHDIVNGTNDYQNLQQAKYPSTAGYDMASGLGSMNAVNLANDIVAMSKAAKGSRLAPASKTWYFAEGSVGSSFQEFLTLQNPDVMTPSQVAITYLFEHAPARTITHSVNPSSRQTIDVNNDLGIAASAPTQSAISAIVQVTSGPAIVAERPMYFNFRNIYASGTDVLGATNPGTSYFFAEADTRANASANAETYISILNPSAVTPANVTLTYYTGNCGATGQAACPTQHLQVGALMRGTGSPASVGLHQQTAVTVTSDQPIVVERPMYFKVNLATAGGVTTGAASQVGATAPNGQWDFAEGFTGPNYQQYYVLANFSATPANVTVKLDYPDATTQSVNVVVKPFSQYNFDVNHYNVGHSDTSSAEIVADNPIVADRLMYFHSGPNRYSGGTDVVGIPLAQSVYSFAEGFTGGNFTEFLTLQNPNDVDETVAITFFGDNMVYQQQVLVKGHSRKTINVNTTINPFNSGVNSMTVQALNGGTIVAERPIYFGYQNDNGGTDVIGYTGN